MSDPPPRVRGPQGVQGVQGIEGIEGQGIQGAQGKPGAVGARGPRGRLVARHVTLSFGLVVVVAFVVLFIFTLQLRQTRQSAQDSRNLIVQSNETRARIVRGFKQSDLALCRSINESRDVLAEVTRGILRASGGTGSGDEARRAALLRLAPKDCSKLPPRGG